MAVTDINGNPSCGPGSGNYQVIAGVTGGTRAWSQSWNGGSAPQTGSIGNSVLWPAGQYPIAIWNNATIKVNPIGTGSNGGSGSASFTFVVTYRDKNEVSHTISFPASVTNGAGNTYGLPNLPADAYVVTEITYSGTVTDFSSATTNYSGYIDFPTAGAQPGPNSGTDVDCPQTDLSASTKILNTAQNAVIGDTVTYTIRVKNDGSIAANAITVSDNVPLAFNNVTWSCAGAVPSSGTGNSISLTIPTLNPGATKDVIISAQALQIGTWSNSATISDQFNTLTRTALPVTIVTAQAPVLTKTATGSTSPGQPVEFVVTLSNYQGTNFANIRDLIPAWVSGASYSLSFSGGASSPNGSIGGTGDVNETIAFNGAGQVQVVINGLVAQNVTAGANFNTATATFTVGQSPSPVTSTTNITIPVQACDVEIIVTPSQTDTAPGQVAQWSVLVTNNGPGVATPLVKADMPAWASAMTYSAPILTGGAAGGTGGSGGINQTITVPPGGTARYTVNATVDSRYRFASLDLGGNIATTCIPSDLSKIESVANMAVRLPVGDGPKAPPIQPDQVNQRYGCIADTCSTTANWVWDAAKGTRCLSTSVRVWTPNNPQPNNAKDVYNALHCHQSDMCANGNYMDAGMAVNVRATSCIDLKVRNDVNGVPAIEANPIFFEPPTYDAASQADLDSCKPGFNVLSCVPARIDPISGETLRGGLSALFKGTDTIRFTTTTDDSCGLNYKVTRADLVINACDNNFLNATTKGLAALIGKTRPEDCIELYVETDDTPCEDNTTSRVLKARPKFAEDRGNYVNTLSCSSTGMASFFEQDECFGVELVTDGVLNGDKVYKIVAKLAPDEGDASDCGLINTLSCGPTGFGSFYKSSDCMNVVTKVIGGRKVVEIVPRFAETYQDGERQIIQGSSCTKNGFGTFFGETSCFKFVSDQGGQGGHTIVRVEPKIAPDIADKSFNLVSCTPYGLSAYIEQFGGCVNMEKVETINGAVSFRPVIKRSELAGNLVQCIAGCGAAQSSTNESGLFVGFNTESKCIKWEPVTDACGRIRLDGCLILDPTYTINCNGLRQTANGYWAPSEIRTGHGYVVGRNNSILTSSGSTDSISLTLTNCDPCRSAVWFVDFQSSAVDVDVQSSNSSAFVSFDGTAGTSTYGQSNYAGHRDLDAFIRYPGMSQTAAFPLPPNGTIALTLKQTVEIIGTAAVRMSDFRISAVMVPGSMNIGPIDGAAVGRSCDSVNGTPLAVGITGNTNTGYNQTNAINQAASGTNNTNPNGTVAANSTNGTTYFGFNPFGQY